MDFGAYSGATIGIKKAKFPSIYKYRIQNVCLIARKRDGEKIKKNPGAHTHKQYLRKERKH